MRLKRQRRIQTVYGQSSLGRVHDLERFLKKGPHFSTGWGETSIETSI